MNRIANSKCRSFVVDREPFQGSNMWGAWVPTTYADRDHSVYVVFSYGAHFPMYVYDPDTNQWYANGDKYSRSTTRHQSQARPDYNGANLTWLNTDNMKQLATRGFRGLAERRVCNG